MNSVTCCGLNLWQLKLGKYKGTLFLLGLTIQIKGLRTTMCLKINEYFKSSPLVFFLFHVGLLSIVFMDFD
jgi:hypothetical protein